MTIDIKEGLYQLRIYDWGIVLVDANDVEHNTIPYSLCVRSNESEPYLKVINRVDSVSGLCTVRVNEIDNRNCDIYATVDTSTDGSLVMGEALFPHRAPNRRAKIEPVSGKYYAHCTPVSMEFLNDKFESFDTFSCNEKLHIHTPTAGVVKFNKHVHEFDGWQRVDVVIDSNGNIVFTMLDGSVNKDKQAKNRENICKFIFGTVDVKCLGIAELIRSEIIPWENRDDEDFFSTDKEIMDAVDQYIMEKIVYAGYNGNPTSAGHYEDKHKLILSVLLGRPMSEYMWKMRESYKTSQEDKVIFNEPTRLFKVLKKDGTPYENEAKVNCPELF